MAFNGEDLPDYEPHEEFEIDLQQEESKNGAQAAAGKA